MTKTNSFQCSKQEVLVHLSIISNPTSSSNPVNIFLDLRRHVKVHHIGHLKLTFSEMITKKMEKIGVKVFCLWYVETASQDSRCHQDVCSSLGKLSQCLMIMIMMMVAIKMVMTTSMMMRWKMTMTMTNLFSLTLAPVTMNAATSKTLPRQFLCKRLIF